MLARYGGVVVHTERIDSGGMFDDTLGVEELPDGRFRAFASGGFGGGGVQCFRATLDDAKRELGRLHEKLHGYDEED